MALPVQKQNGRVRGINGIYIKIAVRLRKAAAAVAVAQRNGDRALGLILPDDVFIQFVYDLFG